MAAIIDGHTYPGLWKLTPDDSSPNAFYAIPKGKIYFKPSDATNGNLYFISDSSGSASICATSSATIDELGNALNTSAKISDYLSKNR